MNVRAFFADIPWFLPAIKTLLGVLVLWLLAAPFARWVLVLLGPAVQSVTAVLGRRVEVCLNRVRSRRDDVRLLRRSLAEQRSTVDVTAVTVWRRAVQTVVEPVRK